MVARSNIENWKCFVSPIAKHYFIVRFSDKELRGEKESYGEAYNCTSIRIPFEWLELEEYGKIKAQAENAAIWASRLKGCGKKLRLEESEKQNDKVLTIDVVWA